MAGDDSYTNADGGPINDGGGDTNDDGRGGDDVDSEINGTADGHKDDDHDHDGGGCLDSVKYHFKNNQVNLEFT